jgi:hypothetical protein
MEVDPILQFMVEGSYPKIYKPGFSGGVDKKVDTMFPKWLYHVEGSHQILSGYQSRDFLEGWKRKFPQDW